MSRRKSWSKQARPKRSPGDFTGRLPVRMPFGPYRGKDIGAAPVEYLKALLNDPQLNPRLRQSILVTLNHPRPKADALPPKPPRDRRRDQPALAEIRDMLNHARWLCRQFRQGPGTPAHSLMAQLAALNGNFPRVRQSKLAEVRERYDRLVAETTDGGEASPLPRDELSNPSESACDCCSTPLTVRQRSKAFCWGCKATLTLCANCWWQWRTDKAEVHRDCTSPQRPLSEEGVTVPSGTVT